MRSCEDCRNYREYIDYHPYGSTYAREVTAECLYDDPPEEWPTNAEECPGFDPIDILDDPLWDYFKDDISLTLDDILPRKILKERRNNK